MFIPLWFLWFIIPVIGSGVLLSYMFRPLESGGSSYGTGMEAMFRLGWLIPILFLWVIFLFVALCAKGC